MAGNLADASQRLRSAYQAFQALGVAAGAGRAAAWLAETGYRARDWDDAYRSAGIAEQVGGGDDREAIVRWGVQAKLAAREGDLVQAQALAQRAARVVEDTDALVDRADAVLNLAQVLRMAGRADEAAHLGRQAEAFYAAKGHVIGVARSQDWGEDGG